jgi:hypothetical protein
LLIRVSPYQPLDACGTSGMSGRGASSITTLSKPSASRIPSLTA